MKKFLIVFILMLTGLGVIASDLIIESKNVESDNNLRGSEDYKINCAKELFRQLEDEGINIKFKKQLSTDKVGIIVRNLLR